MKTIAERFAEAVMRDPQALAIDAIPKTYSYGELSACADEIAYRLNEAADHMDADDLRLVAVLAEHGAPAIIGVLGAVLAGWAYTPLAPRTGSDDLETLIAGSGAKVILTDAANMERAQKLASDGMLVLSLEAIADGAARSDIATSRPSVGPDGPAYVLYTSGMGGAPKQVCHSRSSLLRSVDWYCQDSRLRAGDRVSFVMPLGFTPSVFCLFGALLSGAVLCPFDVAGKSDDAFARWAGLQDLTLIYTTPTIFRRWANGLADVDAASGWDGLRMVQLAGEPLLASDAALFARKFPASVRLYNGMGTTETSCVARFVLDHSMRFAQGCVPVGYPYDDVALVLRNDEGRMLGAGEIGHLFIRGGYFAAGETADPDQTVREFATGDLAISDAGGRLIHCGRQGDRVLVDGVRVDLPEIESLLMDMPEVCEAALIVAPGNDAPELAAFVSLLPEASIGGDELLDRLAENLPAQMVPNHCGLLDRLPVLPAGKVDRLTLVGMVPEQTPGDARRVRPADEIDRLVRSGFCDVLKLDQVMGNEDFFALGGDAHAALELTMRIEEDYGIGMSVSRFAQAPTAINLAHELRRVMSIGRQAAVSSNLQAAWQLDHSDPLDLQDITPEDLPAVFARLLDHQSSMTETLAGWTGRDILLRVLAQQQTGRYFVRKIELSCAPETVLAVAVIRIDLRAFAPDVRQDIIAGQTPFGTIMRAYGIDLQHKVQGVFSSGAMFGRTNYIDSHDGRRLADVLEVLAPDVISAGPSSGL